MVPALGGVLLKLTSLVPTVYVASPSAGLTARKMQKETLSIFFYLVGYCAKLEIFPLFGFLLFFLKTFFSNSAAEGGGGEESVSLHEEK